MKLRDFFDSFIIRDEMEVSIYNDEKLLVEYEPVTRIFSKYKKLLNKEVSYIDLDHHNDMTWIMIVIKD
jgi:hypothetical protein